MSALSEHLKTGTTTVCRAWAVTRKDGVTLGFTDHDRALNFDGVDFNASTGMTARAIEQTTGLAVDNTEAVGALSSVAIRDEDVRAGLFDGAEVLSWLVNWTDVGERKLVFRGSLGEIERKGKSFRAELRGLAEALNTPNGRVYQRPCGAVLGDGMCRFDLSTPGYAIEAEVISVTGGTELILPEQAGISEGWFARGRVEVLSGAAKGAVGVVKRDRDASGLRILELWEILSAGFAPGDLIRVEAGCDKSVTTCREKFGNFLNFRGFPDIPGEDWMVSYPVADGENDGGSLR